MVDVAFFRTFGCAGGIISVAAFCFLLNDCFVNVITITIIAISPSFLMNLHHHSTNSYLLNPPHHYSPHQYFLHPHYHH
jgi:hypothetical protein